MPAPGDWNAAIRARLTPLLGAPPDAEFVDELAAHLAQAYDDARREGGSEDESRAAALRLLDESSPWLDAARERARRPVPRRIREWTRQEAPVPGERGGSMYRLGFMRDARHALRMLVRTPGFSAVAIMTFALGIGINAAVFSVVNGVLLRPLPYPEADRITMVWVDNTREKIKEDINSYPNYRDWRDQNSSYAHLAGYADAAFTLTGAGEPERLLGAEVTTNFFDVMGIRPTTGRLFTEANEIEGRDRVIVISHGLWQRRFGGAADVIGRTITLSTRPHEIIGVMPPEMRFPEGAELWKPLAPAQGLREARGSFWLPVIGRLRPGVSVQQAQTEMAGISARIAEQFPGNRGYGANVVGFREQLVGSVQRPLAILMASVLFVLLIACANLANLMLGRTAARRRELAVRTALGAGRARLVRQILTESLVLAMIGGAAGVLLAYWTTGFFVSLAGDSIPGADQIRLDARVLLFAVAAATVAALIAGLLPALHASRAAVADVLREGGRQGGPSGSGRTRNVLVAAEVALALVLLTGAGLLLQTLWGMQRVDRGFQIDRIGMATISLPGSVYPTPDAARAFYARLLEKVRAVPGVESASLASGILQPLLTNSAGFAFEGKPLPPQEQRPEYPFESVSPGFFDTIGARIVRGRGFTEQDHARAPFAVIVNETLATSVWPGEDPIGRRLKPGDGTNPQAPWLTVVGVVKDLRRADVKRHIRPEIYFSSLQRTRSTQILVYRAAGDPAAVMPAIRREVQQLDPQLALFRVTSLRAALSNTLRQPRFQATLLGGFAAIALLLASIGIYGVTSHAVAQRTQEVGIRMAMGAQRSAVRALMLKQHVTPALVGVAVGLAGALALSRFLASLLYGVRAVDPWTYLAVTAALVGVAIAACWIPASRAMRVDPLVALRAE
ncbi:MAG TPA: ABC transporter permease [Vicinamibacterales bacterium]|nr:ABC transporter permease [Vicinamibacterales bacterium]